MESTYDTQGHGVAGHYGGLSDEKSHFNHAHIVILPVAFDLTTTYRQGADRGPAALIEASRHMELYDIETNSEVYLKGICTLSSLTASSSEQMCTLVYKKVKELIEQKKYVVTLGGEHTIAWGAIKAHAELYGPLTILHLDAHTDLQPTYEGNPWSHACVMARVKELEGIVNIVSIGIRSMSRDELDQLKNVEIFFAHALDEGYQWMEQALGHMQQNVYLTFDLDVFDSALMPATGTPEPGGLLWKEVTTFLYKVTQNKKIVGFDVVELCPLPPFVAPDFLAAKLVYKILSYVMV